MSIEQHTLMKFWSHSPVGMALIELDGKFRRVNPHFEVITGYSAYELERMRWQDITLQSDIDPDAAMTAEVWNGDRESYTMDKSYIRKPPKNGIQPIRLQVYRLDDSSGKPDCLLAIVTVKEPKAVIQDGRGERVSVEAKEGLIRIGVDKKMIGLALSLCVALVGWLATVQYALSRIDRQERQLESLTNELIKGSVKARSEDTGDEDGQK